MTISMRKIQSGRGYDYPLKSVVRGTPTGESDHAVLHRGRHSARTMDGRFQDTGAMW
jgi:hypothetical protein